MPSIRDLKRRIRSVSSTQQITKAMEMVSAAKLRRAQMRLAQARPYGAKAEEILKNLSGAAAEVSHPLLEVRPVTKTTLVAFTSDRGLCGSFNTNVIRKAEQFLKDYYFPFPQIISGAGGIASGEAFGTPTIIVGSQTQTVNEVNTVGITSGKMTDSGGSPGQIISDVGNIAPEEKFGIPTLTQKKGKGELVLVGKKAFDFYKRRKWPIRKIFTDFGGNLQLAKARALANELMKAYENKETDQIFLLYTRFLSTTTYRVALTPFLPLVPEKKGEVSGDYIFEPSPADIFEQLIPRFCLTRIVLALAESFASEHGARMISMGGATKNAGEMIENLTLVRNKVRQAGITKELLEIVGGAEALQ